ncbi:Hypothetical_protein [Hexamita inflata]|uniref:Hypothetical_protein n=1 Tax=Hexamita inflata TaxID=28002 RepID=A0AA86QGN9_9EUKA|nr:Hypothetical protein HINF_LOCUS45553 [Hexamita inflata]CAI9961731.1 Hypothetical protein HINF_LOCUS49376 [Hexamita inflata]
MLIYYDFSECYFACQNGYCTKTAEQDYKSNSWSYECVQYETHHNNSKKLLLLLLIPLAVIIINLTLCCLKMKEKKIRIQRAQAQKRAQVVKTQTAQVNQTKVLPEQVVTLPNGQVGVFLPLTQPQQEQVRQVQYLQVLQFYQPQPIQQIYQPLRIVQEQVRQVQSIPTQSNFQESHSPEQRIPQYISMPIMPAIPQ